jgi:hypothetical protein
MRSTWPDVVKLRDKVDALNAHVGGGATLTASDYDRARMARFAVQADPQCPDPKVQADLTKAMDALDTAAQSNAAGDAYRISEVASLLTAQTRLDTARILLETRGMTP